MPDRKKIRSALQFVREIISFFVLGITIQINYSLSYVKIVKASEVSKMTGKKIFNHDVTFNYQNHFSINSA